jgi:hypothetical protein
MYSAYIYIYIYIYIYTAVVLREINTFANVKQLDDMVIKQAGTSS